MSEDLKTIKELADKLDINKLRIYRFIDKEKIVESKIINTTKHYDLEAQNRIISHFVKANNDNVDNSGIDNDKDDNDNVDNGRIDNDKADNDNVDNGRIDNDKVNNDSLLHEKDSRIKFLEVEIGVKNNHISQMQNLLDQQQHLALQDKKLLEEYKTENDRLKSLKMPVDNDKERDFVETMKETYEDELVQLNQDLAKQEELREKAEAEKEILLSEREALKSKKWYKFWK